MSTCAWKKGKTYEIFHKCFSRIAGCIWVGMPLYPWFNTKYITRDNQQLAWISSEEEELIGFVIKKRKRKEIPQGVIELSASGKMTKTRANSITLKSFTEKRVVVHYGQNFWFLVLFELASRYGTIACNFYK